MNFYVLRELIQKTKKFVFEYKILIYLAVKVWGISLGIALILSIILNMRELNPVVMWENFLKYSFHMSIGYFVHICLLLLFVRFHLLPETKNIKGFIRFFLVGAVVTFMIFLAIKPHHLRYTWSFFSLMGFIFAICLIMQLFLLVTNIYNVAIIEQKRLRKNKLLKGVSQKQPEYVLVKSDKEEMKQIFVENLSTLYVEDHYLNFVLEKDKTFQMITVYGRLIDYEETLGARFLKINRSTLINIKHIEIIHKKKDRYIIIMKGLAEKPLVLPKTRNYIIESLPIDLIKEVN